VNYTALGQRIRHLRLQQQMTQAQLAEKLDISTSYLGHIERGVRCISLETLIKLCFALQTSPNSLLLSELRGMDESLLTEIPIENKRKIRDLLSFACSLVSDQ